MKFKKLMAALENFEESPLAEPVVAIVDGNVVDPQAVVDAGAPVNEPATIPDAGEMPNNVPTVAPLPIIEEPVVAEVAPLPAGVEGEPSIADSVQDAYVGQLIVDSPTDHDNTMSMMDQTLVEETAMRNDVGELVEAQVAMEAYAKLLKQAGPDGITRQAAGFLRVGLEQFHNDGHIDFSKEIASMEEMGEGQKQHLLPSKIKSGGLGEKIKEIAKKLWEWLKGLWAKGKKFVEQLKTGVVQLDRKLKKAQALAEKAGNKAGGEFTVPNPERIAIGNKVEINFPNEMKAVAMMAGKVYPERMVEFYNAIATTLANYDVASGDPADVMAQLEKAKGILEDVSSSKTTLPGGVRLDVSEDGISYGIAEDEKPEVGETKAAARSASTIAQQLKEMTAVLEILKSYDQIYAKMAHASEGVEQACVKLYASSGKDDMEASAGETAGQIVSAVSNLLHKANPRGNEIIRYLAHTTSAYVDVVLAELGGADQASKEVAVA